MSEDIIFGLRYWDTGVPEIEGFHIAEEFLFAAHLVCQLAS